MRRCRHHLCKPEPRATRRHACYLCPPNPAIVADPRRRLQLAILPDKESMEEVGTAQQDLPAFYDKN